MASLTAAISSGSTRTASMSLIWGSSVRMSRRYLPELLQIFSAGGAGPHVLPEALVRGARQHRRMAGVEHHGQVPDGAMGFKTKRR